MKKVQEITTQLFTLQDSEYKDFHGKLMPTITPDTILGIRVPILRKFSDGLAKSLSKEKITEFMNELPHKYYEENNVHAFLIEKIKSFGCFAAKNQRIMN